MTYGEIKKQNLAVAGSRWRLTRAREGHEEGEVLTVKDTGNLGCFESCAETCAKKKSGTKVHGVELFLSDTYTGAKYLGPSKPTHLEIGQRWRVNASAGIYTVSSPPRGDDRWGISWNSGKSVSWYRAENILCDEYVGMAPAVKPEASRWPAVEVGQRRLCNGSEYVVEAMYGDGRFKIRWVKSGNPGIWSEADLIGDKYLGTVDEGVGDPVEAPQKAADPDPIRREVSEDGRNWVDYERLIDADPFEAYAHARLVMDGGRGGRYYVDVRRPTPKKDPGRAETVGDLAGAAAAALVTRA